MKARKPLGGDLAQVIGQRFGLVHEQRGVRLDALAIAPAEEPADRLPGGLPENVPQRDVDTADGVGEAAAAPQPEGVLVQLLADPLRLQRVLAPVERLHDGERGADQTGVGEDAADPGETLVGADETAVCERCTRAAARSLQPPSGVAPARPTAWISWIRTWTPGTSQCFALRGEQFGSLALL